MNGIVIVASLKDQAGTSIANMLLNRFEFKETDSLFDGNMVYVKDQITLAFTDREIIFADHLDAYFQASFYIFVSKHKAESGIPSLTAHFTGNFSDDISVGGRVKELAHTYPSLLKTYFSELWKLKDRGSGYHMVIEASHHGPTSLMKPLLYVEIGSTVKEWFDKKAAEVVADAIMNTLSYIRPSSKIGIGFGGTHYPDKFSRLLLDSEFAFGSIAARYALPYIDTFMIEQMIGKSVEEVRYAVLDWKGLGQEKTGILDLLSNTGLEVVKV